jgi:hypothetical protein
MSLLPQLEQELHLAATRPSITRRVAAVVAIALVAAMIALLISAPPSIAGRPALASTFAASPIQ